MEITLQISDKFKNDFEITQFQNFFDYTAKLMGASDYNAKLCNEFKNACVNAFVNKTYKSELDINVNKTIDLINAYFKTGTTPYADKTYNGIYFDGDVVALALFVYYYILVLFICNLR